MDAFKIIRREAAEKRDRAIANARHDFAETLSQIEELEKSLKEPVVFQRHKRPIVDLIKKVMPRDREFTLNELLSLMNAEDPSRKYLKASVRTMVHRLCQEGLARRTQKGGGRRTVKFVSAACELPDYVFEGMSQIEVAELVLRQKGEPMTLAEIVIDMLVRGFQTDTDERAMMNSIGACMRKSPGRFVKDGGRWSIYVSHVE